MAKLGVPKDITQLATGTRCEQVFNFKLREVFESADFDILDDAWATTYDDHLARCGGGALVHNTAHSLFVTTLAENYR
jgi:hypothetical protein